VIRLPNNSDRLICLGRTGTGKTIAGLYHLSNYDLDSRPWVLLDFKNEEHFDEIENLPEINFDYIPSKKDTGLFRLRCTPFDARGTVARLSRVDAYLVKLWEREEIGIFADECYMLGNSEALNLCLTQGRSKRIPMILCSQRPAWISRFAFSEASFIQVFDLNDARDIDTVESFVPIEWDKEKPLKKHQSFYFDIGDDSVVRLNPVPSMRELKKVFAQKLVKHRVRL
jgi:hypothetical protein